jgi:hypothetical protein
MKKIVFIDVGTHFGQEYKSMFGGNFDLLIRILRQYIGYNLLKKGPRLSLKDLVSIFHSRSALNKNNTYHIFVEANPLIINSQKIYKYADSIFNIAVTDNKKANLVKLYVNRNNIMGEGNSIFRNKKLINVNQYMLTWGIPSDEFCKLIKNYLDSKFEKYILILRINCEGMEENFIHAAIKIFGKKIKLISGSLKDVKEIKSLKAYNDLMMFLLNQNIPFIEFTPSIPTWPKAHKKVLEIYKKFFTK